MVGINQMRMMTLDSIAHQLAMLNIEIDGYIFSSVCRQNGIIAEELTEDEKHLISNLFYKYF